jgi:serine/threonine protein kinase
MAQLEHPNIVAVIDFLSQGSNFFLVLEYVDGPTLRNVQPHLSLPTALHIVSEMTSAVDYAHRRGIVHRDLKPENVLFTPSGRTKLTDFGIAKILSATAYGGELSSFSTQAGNILGTAAYISPEAAGAKGRIDYRADLYGLGVMTYELLVRRLPFEWTSDFYSMLAAHATRPVPRPTALVAGFPEDVEVVLLRALEKDPDRRQRDVGTFWTELHQAASACWSGWEDDVDLSEITEHGTGRSTEGDGATRRGAEGRSVDARTPGPTRGGAASANAPPDDRPTIHGVAADESGRETRSAWVRRATASEDDSEARSRQPSPDQDSRGLDRAVYQPPKRSRRLPLILIAVAVPVAAIVIAIVITQIG